MLKHPMPCDMSVVCNAASWFGLMPGASLVSLGWNGLDLCSSWLRSMVLGFVHMVLHGGSVAGGWIFGFHWSGTFARFSL